MCFNALNLIQSHTVLHSHVFYLKLIKIYILIIWSLIFSEYFVNKYIIKNNLIIRKKERKEKRIDEERRNVQIFLYHDWYL